MNEYYTPPEIMDRIRAVLGGIDLDPASCEYANRRCVKADKFFTQEDDGFGRRWWGRVYLNPPSGRSNGRHTLIEWWDKLVWEYLMGRVEAAVFMAFHPGVYHSRPKYHSPHQYPRCFLRSKAQWVRPNGGRYVARECASVILLSDASEVIWRFERHFTPLGELCL